MFTLSGIIVAAFNPAEVTLKAEPIKVQAAALVVAEVASPHL